MKKLIAIAIMLALLLTLGVTVALAGGGKGDDQPGVKYNLGTCGIPAGPWGWFTSPDYFWATYDNGLGVLKCTTHLNPGQVPPPEKVTIPGDGLCNTPGGLTSDYFTRVFPNGTVNLICRVY